jgi:hypothetical protein
MDLTKEYKWLKKKVFKNKNKEKNEQRCGP